MGLGIRLGTLLASSVLFSLAACTATTVGEGGDGGSSGTSGSSGASSSSGSSGTSGSSGSSGASSSSGASGTVPAPSTTSAPVEIGGTCAAFTACGGAVSGTYDYTSGCVEEDLLAAAKQQCPTLDASGLKFTVVGSLHFAGSSLTRKAVGKVSGPIVIPVSCSAGQCAAVESALKSGFDSISCTGSSSCTCTVTKTNTTDNATTFLVSGSTITTGDGESYSFCSAGSSFQYKGKSAGSEDGIWTLAKR